MHSTHTHTQEEEEDEEHAAGDQKGDWASDDDEDTHIRTDSLQQDSIDLEREDASSTPPLANALAAVTVDNDENGTT